MYLTTIPQITRLRLCLLALFLGLVGCAELPNDLPTRPALKAPHTAATISALGDPLPRPETPTPQTGHWWQAFHLAALDALIEKALADHPDLVAATARLHRAEQAERLAHLQAGVGYSTDASINTQHLSKFGLLPPPIGGRSFNQTDITQNISYNLDWWGKQAALIHAAHDEQQAARFEAAAVQLTIAATVADTYFAWADVGARLTKARLLQQQHRAEVELRKTRRDLGLDSVQSLHEARARLAMDDDRLYGLEYQERALRYRMGAALGTDPDATATLPLPTLNAALPPLPTDLPVGWLAKRPDIAALQQRVAAAAEKSAATHADFFPNLDLRLMVGLETLNLENLLRAGAISTSLGPSLHLPYFNTNTLRAALNAREAEYAARVAEYNRAILEAARQVVDAYAFVKSLAEREQAERQALAELQQARALVRQRAKLGLTSLLETLEKDNSVLNQELTTIETEAANLRARVALFLALGGDTAPETTPP